MDIADYRRTPGRIVDGRQCMRAVFCRTGCSRPSDRGGFSSVAYFGAYDPAVHAGATDRLVAVAQLAASFSPAAVKQEQRIGFDCLRRVASPQLALRRFDRRPDPLRRIVG